MWSYPRLPGPGAIPARRTALALAATAALLLSVLCLGCGYKNGNEAQLIVPERFRKLAITEVENPTLQADLGMRLRSQIRDELTKRGQVQWVDRSQAKGIMKIDVDRFTTSSATKDQDERTLNYSVTLLLSATITDPVNNKLIWDSGPLSVSEVFLVGEASAAEQLVLELAARGLADRLGNDF